MSTANMRWAQSTTEWSFNHANMRIDEFGKGMIPTHVLKAMSIIRVIRLMELNQLTISRRRDTWSVWQQQTTTHSATPHDECDNNIVTEDDTKSIKSTCLASTSTWTTLRSHWQQWHQLNLASAVNQLILVFSIVLLDDAICYFIRACCIDCTIFCQRRLWHATCLPGRSTVYMWWCSLLHHSSKYCIQHPSRACVDCCIV